ncbi:MAG TPA: hypothetical protein VGM82_11675 [Gemmatimonadaceae bacterium]
MLGTTAGYGLCGRISAGWACWGRGFGLSLFQPTPVAVAFGMTWADVSMGYNSDETTCAMRGNSVWCWGLNDVGQVGDGTYGNLRFVPTAVNIVP